MFVEAGAPSAQACARPTRIFSTITCLLIHRAKVVVQSKLTTRVARSHRCGCEDRLTALCDMRIAADGHGERSGLRWHDCEPGTLQGLPGCRDARVQVFGVAALRCADADACWDFLSSACDLSNFAQRCSIDLEMQYSESGTEKPFQPRRQRIAAARRVVAGHDGERLARSAALWCGRRECSDATLNSSACMTWTFRFSAFILTVAMQHDVSIGDSGGGSSYGYYEAIFALPSPFHKPLDETELAMLAA
eukprot:4390260-Pleurochrysis_carterae.AAC.3